MRGVSADGDGGLIGITENRQRLIHSERLQASYVESKFTVHFGAGQYYIVPDL